MAFHCCFCLEISRCRWFTQNLRVDPQTNNRDTCEMQPNPNSNTRVVELDSSRTVVVDTPADYGGIDGGMYYALDGYPAQFFIGGYDYPVNWDGYSRPADAEGTTSQNPGSFSDNGPLVYHPSGFAYNPQHLYAPYTSGAPLRGDGQLNTAHGCHYPGHIYQQLTTSDASFVPSTAPPSLENSPVNSRESTNGRAGNATARRNNVLSSARTGYRGYHSDRGILPIVSTQSSVSQDVRVGYEDGRIGAMSSDLPKATEIQQRHNNITSVGHNGRPMALLLVNRSGQFCGVAEMNGPVDFNKTMGFWQRDNWTGKVPLKWHIIKDVPNSQFRHIILENNDNKPVPLNQGIEMLNIFKSYNVKTSILDDFQFYETL